MEKKRERAVSLPCSTFLTIKRNEEREGGKGEKGKGGEGGREGGEEEGAGKRE